MQEFKGILSETRYLFIPTYQISSFQHNPNKFETGVSGVGGVGLPNPAANQTPQIPTQIRAAS